jgi:hypothetical protein
MAAGQGESPVKISGSFNDRRAVHRNRLRAGRNNVRESEQPPRTEKLSGINKVPGRRDVSVHGRRIAKDRPAKAETAFGNLMKSLMNDTA